MMNCNADFAEQVQVVAAFVPVDLAGGAQTGDWVSLKNYERCTVILFKAAGAAGEDATITLEEAQDVSGTGAQNLAVIDKVYQKQGTLNAVAEFSAVTQTAAATYIDTDSGENQGIYAFDVQSEELSDGFTSLRISTDDPGVTAQLAGALYLLWPARYGEQALPSAIAD